MESGMRSVIMGGNQAKGHVRLKKKNQ